MTNEKTELHFTITVDGQRVNVRYRPDYFSAAGYAHFEFTGPQPGRRTLISETGYRSHFSPMWEISEAPSVEEYARELASALIRRGATSEQEADEEPEAALQAVSSALI